MLHAVFVVALLAAQPTGFETPLRAEMLSRGVPAAQVVMPFAPSARIERFAASATAAAATPKQKAERLYEAIRALKRKGAIAADRDNTPKARAPKTADELLAIALGEATGNAQAGCYELSALYVASARTLGLDAVGIERDDTVGSGQIGHVMAGVRLGAAHALVIYDLQNEVRGTGSPYIVLDDLAFVAHHYNHWGVSLFLARRYREALRVFDWARALNPESASFRNNHATTLIALGEPGLAAAEALEAVERRPEVPLYRYQLGRALMLEGDLDAAITSFQAALELKSRYGIVRRDLGWALLLRGDERAAERELVRAVREAPDVPEVALYLGLYYLARGKQSEAREVADNALRRAPTDASLLALAALSGASSRAVVDSKVRAELETTLQTLRSRLETSGAAKAR